MKRATAASRRSQIEALEKLIAQAERGELVTADQVAVGISEATVKSLLNASLSQEIDLAKRVRVRLVSGEPFFRGNTAGLLLVAKATSLDLADATATIEMGGGLEEFRLEKGKLTARVKLVHFRVKDVSLGDLAADALEALVRSQAEAIQSAIPPIEIPVHFEEQIKIGGLDEGAVVAHPGSLPLNISVSQVLPVNERLWILLQAKAGPWQSARPAATAKPQ
jgi:hypothetical protein